MYETDEEYRAFLRQITNMDPSKFYETDDIYCDPTDPKVSPETIDEYNYDSASITQYLDKVFSDTKSRPEFQRLYTAAAALMFSEKQDIGLAVLMSYDYLAYFHTIYVTYLKTPDSWSAETDTFYQKLIDRIETK